MARIPRGTTPQALSRTSLFAYFAARLGGHPTHSFDELFKNWNLGIGRDGALRAASAAKRRSPTRRSPGRKGGPARLTTARPATFQEWLLVDELALDLDVALLRFQGRGARQTDLLASLAVTPGVRQIVETAHQRDVYAIAVFEGAEQRRELRAHVEEVADEVMWDDVLFESHLPAEHMWRHLARRAAEHEQLAE